MNYLVYFIISFLFFSCSKNIKISEMDKSYNARILQIMNENSSYKFNYFYYEIKNYTHKDYSKVAYEIEDFVDNSYISSIAKNKRAEIYCFFYTKRWWYRRINLNDTEEADPILGVAIISVYMILAIVLFTPSLAVKVRRLRDAGLHWAFIFLHFVPMGGIALLVLLAMPTKEVEIVTIDSSKEVEAEEVSPFE